MRASDFFGRYALGSAISGSPQKRSTWYAQKNFSNLQELRLCCLVVRQWAVRLRQIT